MSAIALIAKGHDVERTAQIIGRSPKLVYKLAERGELGHFKIAGRLTFTDGHIDEYIRRCERPAKVAA